MPFCGFPPMLGWWCGGKPRISAGIWAGHGRTPGWLSPPSIALIHRTHFAPGHSPGTETQRGRPRRNAWGAFCLLPGRTLRNGVRRGPCILFPDTGTLSTSSPPVETRQRSMWQYIGMNVKNKVGTELWSSAVRPSFQTRVERERNEQSGTPPRCASLEGFKSATPLALRACLE